MRYSIQRRILVSGAALLTMIGLLMFLAVRFYTQNAADEAFDRVLGAAALTIADTIEIENGEVLVDLPHSAFAILGTSRLNRVFYRILAPDGSLVTGSPILGLEVLGGEGLETRFVDSVYREEPVRIATVSRFTSEWPGGGWVQILLGETREARSELSWRLTLNAVWPVAGVSLCAFVLILFAVRSAFLPLRAVERDLTERGAADLAPIAGPVPREVSSLVSALNDFMERLDATLSTMRAFTADAAHQLRTPLMAMRAQSEVALDEATAPKAIDRLRRIHLNAVSASNLANQLLADATTFHSLRSGARETLDLRGVIAETTTRLNLEHDQPGGASRLSLELARDAVPVHAEPIALREMIRNLIENALVHTDGAVDIRLMRRNGQALLLVEDRGQGIADADKRAVFGRFVRGRTEASGSGLGLAIARSVAASFAGRIRLLDRPGGGLTVEVALPLAHDTPAGRGRASLIALAWLAALAGTAANTPDAAADPASQLSLVGSMPTERMGAVLAAIGAVYPDLHPTYTQALPSQAVAQIAARGELPVDLLILPTPDLMVMLANEGFAHQSAFTAANAWAGHWRSEVFTLGYDPAVILYRNAAFRQPEFPRRRADLATLLEDDGGRFRRRVGLVNIGIDAVAYATAAQDALRSGLYLRTASAFGLAEARIYETVSDLLQDLQDGRIDIAYNVPLSQARAAMNHSRTVTIVMPEDDVVQLPITALIPRTARHAEAAERILRFLLTPAGRASLEAAGILPAQPAGIPATQRVSLGPELLVYLDRLKRSRFLDGWFQAVVTGR